MFENEHLFETVGDDRRARRRAETRRRLLVAGMEVFVQGGYESATVRDIAAAADLGLGTLYAHFKDKSELLDALLDEAVANLGRGLRAAAGRESGAVERLSAACRALFEFALQHRELFQILFDAGIGSQERREKRRRLFLDGVRDMLRAGIAQGVFGEWDEDLASAAVVAIIARAVPLVLKAGGKRSAQLIEQAIGFAVAALSGAPRSPESQSADLPPSDRKET